MERLARSLGRGTFCFCLGRSACAIAAGLVRAASYRKEIAGNA